MGTILRVLFSMAFAIILGRLVSKLKLPAILGWLITGMIVGPYAFGILDFALLEGSSYKLLLSLLEAFVGIMIGSELVLRTLKKSGKQIIVTTLFQSVGTFIFVSACFFIVFKFMDFPSYLALVFGAIALATAPAPALSIVKEFKTKGPVTNTLIPMAALDDVVAIVIFFTVMTLIGSSGQGGGLLSLAQGLFVMIFIPSVIGLILGFISGKIMNLSDEKSHLAINIIVSIIVVTAVGQFINMRVLPDPVINFMLLGMAYAAGFANTINDKKLEKALSVASPMIGISIILVIVNLGAPLDYSLIFGAGVLTLIYILSRMVGKYSGAYLGAKVSKLPDTVQKYLGLTLLPHSGVSLVFTGIAVATLMPINPEYATVVQGTIAAAAILNEIVAVIISKKAFEWSGEIGQDVSS